MVGKNEPERVAMLRLNITWRYLADEQGQTCTRCAETDRELVKAVRFLQKALAPVGIIFDLERSPLTPAEFAQDPLQSNRITIGGRDLEKWLKAEVGKSPCCGPCGDTPCRTLNLKDKTYETIPAELIIQAGLQAAYEKVKKHGHKRR